MKIWAYAICWNEEKMLPYYLRYYEQYCEKIVIYDNFSTDNSRELIKACPKAELRMYSTNNQIRDDIYTELKNNCWKEARGQADLVIVGDIDEFIWAEEGLQNFVSTHPEIDVFIPEGYDMVSPWFPQGKGQIIDEIRYGFRHDTLWAKLMLFNPNTVTETNYRAGCHDANLQGQGLKFFQSKGELKMLHMKSLGIEWIYRRHSIYRDRMSQHNINLGLGVYNNQSQDFRMNHEGLMNKSKPVLACSKYYDGVYNIRKATIKELLDKNKLAEIICSFGLSYVDTRLNYSLFTGWEQHSVKYGETGVCQHPIQLAEFLIKLSQYRIRTFLEIGILNGYNMGIIAEYLRRFNADVQVWGLDINDYRNADIAKITPHTFLHGHSHNLADIKPFQVMINSFIDGATYPDWEIEEAVKFDNFAKSIENQGLDLCFIDGNHSYEWVSNDWLNMGQFAKLCAFHDIQEHNNPWEKVDVPQFWNELKANFAENQISEFIYTNDNQARMGIGFIDNNHAKREIALTHGEVFDFNNPFSYGKRRNLLLTTVGKNALVEDWLLSDDAVAEFDVKLIAYDIEAFLRYQNSDKITAIQYSKGLKYELIKAYIENNIYFVSQYDYIFMPDDDICIRTQQINKLFEFMNKYSLALAQCTLDDTHKIGVNASHAITIQAPDKSQILRFTNFVEVQQPCFSLKMLRSVLPYLTATRTSWGVDLIWSDLACKLGERVAIIDAIPTKHTKATNISDGEFYQVAGVTDPQKELQDVMKKYFLDFKFQDYGAIRG